MYGGKTGYAAGLLQDDHAKLSKWFASKSDARMIVRQVCKEIMEKRMTTETELAHLRSLVKKLFYYLDYQEESDGGKLFNPITISCCRALMTQPLNELLDEMKTIATEETP